MTMRLLDLFCGAGGAAMGYHQAGFDEIVGVDIKPQPHYPFTFVQADALDLPWFIRLADFDLIHTSPPCQSYSALKGLVADSRPALIEPTRRLLVQSGVPWVIENVVGAPLIDPIRLCGSMFGLGVRRHRLFEMSFDSGSSPTCRHELVPEPIDVTGTCGPFCGVRKTPGGGVSRKPQNVAHARAVMGIDWMTRKELSEAIPPTYTRYVGERFLAQT